MRTASLASQLPVLAEVSPAPAPTIPSAGRLIRLGRVRRLPAILSDPLARYHKAALADRDGIAHQVQLFA